MSHSDFICRNVIPAIENLISESQQFKKSEHQQIRQCQINNPQNILSQAYQIYNSEDYSVEMAKLLVKCAEQLQPALELLSSNKLFWSVARSEVPILLDLLSSSTQKIPEPVRLAIIALLLIKFPNELASQDHKSLSQELVKLLKSSNYKKVVAALLVRLPNYSSFKQVLQYLDPALVPISRMLQLSSKLKDSSSTQYEKQIAKFRVEWCALSASSELKFEEIEEIYDQLSGVAIAGTIDSFELQSKLETQTNYLLERIALLGTQKIDLSKICVTLEKLIAGVPYQLADIREEIRESVNQVRSSLRVSGLLILNALLNRLQRKFIRRYAWLLLVHEYCVSSPSSVKFLLLSLTLTLNILRTFGPGSLKLTDLLFTSTHSLLSLLRYIFQRRPIVINKQQMNYRRDKHPGRPKQDKPVLNLIEPNMVFEQPLTHMSKHEESQVILKVLEVFRAYYSKPHDSSCQHTAQLLELVDLNEGKLSGLAVEVYRQVKGLVLPQNAVFSGDVEGVYQELWVEKSKRKMMRNTLTRTIEIEIKPNNVVGTRALSSSLPGKPTFKHIQSQQCSDNHSLQGWGTPNKQKPSQQKPKADEQPSQMFYSFHDSNFHDSKYSKVNQDTNKQPIQDDFILTPSFQ